MKVMTKLKEVLQEKGTAAFYRDDLFPTLATLVWPHLEDDTSGGSLPGRKTRKYTVQETELTSKSQTFHGYSLTVNLNSALKKVMYLIIICIHLIKTTIDLFILNFNTIT